MFDIWDQQLTITIGNSLMLDLQKYSCLGAALRDALDRFSAETCLIEADRDREKTRLTYSDFKEISLPLARALEDAEFDADVATSGARVGADLMGCFGELTNLVPFQARDVDDQRDNQAERIALGTDADLRGHGRIPERRVLFAGDPS